MLCGAITSLRATGQDNLLHSAALAARKSAFDSEDK